MTVFIGCDPGTVFSAAQLTAGSIAPNGTKASIVDGTGTREFISCNVSAGNITTGQVVNISSTFTCAVISAGGGPRNDRQIIGVAICTATASTAFNIWVQIYGRCNVIASTSCAVNVLLSPATNTAGGVDDAPVVSASAVLEGIITLASTNATATLVAAWLEYPKWGSLA